MILKPFVAGSEVSRIDMMMQVAGEDELRALRTRRANAVKGDAGERETARALDRHFGPSLRTGVVHDVMLETRGVTIQIDHLLVSRALSTAWLVETKNLSGRISINDDGEWIQTLDDHSRTIPSPLDQAQGAAMGLGKWFEDNGFGVIDQIVPLVAVPHTTTIDRKSVRHDRNVVKADMLATWWDEWIGDQTLAWMLSKAWRRCRKGLDAEGLAKLGQSLKTADKNVRDEFQNRRRKTPDVVDERQICDGVYTMHTVRGIAIKHRNDTSLRNRVSAAAEGIAEWNERYGNWIVPEDRIDAFSKRLIGSEV
jgi:hypothetical protein